MFAVFTPEMRITSSSVVNKNSLKIAKGKSEIVDRCIDCNGQITQGTKIQTIVCKRLHKKPKIEQHVLLPTLYITKHVRDRKGRDLMVVRFATTYAISDDYH
jgi:hypothetical protein